MIDFNAIPFPNGKGQVRGRNPGFLRDLCVLCGEIYYGPWSDTNQVHIKQMNPIKEKARL